MSDWRDGERTRSADVERLGEGRFVVTVDGARLELSAETTDGGRLRIHHDGEVTPAVVTAAGDRFFVRLGRMDFVLERASRAGRRRGGAHGGGLDAPMPGAVTRVMVAAGEDVKKGQPLMALEAMKMEHLIRAPHDGRVKAVLAQAGAMVDGGAALVEMEDAAQS